MTKFEEKISEHINPTLFKFLVGLIVMFAFVSVTIISRNDNKVGADGINTQVVVEVNGTMQLFDKTVKTKETYLDNSMNILIFLEVYIEEETFFTVKEEVVSRELSLIEDITGAYSEKHSMTGFAVRLYNKNNELEVMCNLATFHGIPKKFEELIVVCVPSIFKIKSIPRRGKPI